MKSYFVTSTLVLGLVVAGSGAAQQKTIEPDLAMIVSGQGGVVQNRAATSTEMDGRPAVRLDERLGDGVAYWPNLTFSNGSIEFDVRGRNVPGRSFLGVAFHGLDETTFDAVYFRPFNFRAEDPARRGHALQYIAHPKHTWFSLRQAYPEQYENPIAVPPDPSEWLHVRIEVAHPKVSVFVNGAAEPDLVVNQLSDRKTGWVGFWVGNGSDGEFANLKLTPRD